MSKQIKSPNYITVAIIAPVLLITIHLCFVYLIGGQTRISLVILVPSSFIGFAAILARRRREIMDSSTKVTAKKLLHTKLVQRILRYILIPFIVILPAHGVNNLYDSNHLIGVLLLIFGFVLSLVYSNLIDLSFNKS